MRQPSGFFQPELLISSPIVYRAWQGVGEINVGPRRLTGRRFLAPILLLAVKHAGTKASFWGAALIVESWNLAIPEKAARSEVSHWVSLPCFLMGIPRNGFCFRLKCCSTGNWPVFCSRSWFSQCGCFFTVASTFDGFPFPNRSEVLFLSLTGN